MKRILFITLCLAIILTACAPSIQIVNAYTVEYQQEQFGYRDLRALEDRIDQLSDRMATAHDMAEAARSLGYSEDHQILLIAKKEYDDAYAMKQEYQAIYDDLSSRWQAKRDQFPVATYVWETLAEAGYSDTVIAGILGNMMAECGGHTLALDWQVRGTYYGLCQWSCGYAEVWGASLEEQCEFLLSTIKYELDTYGYMYKKGYTHDNFVSMTDIQQTALMFARSYERCGSSTHRLRQQLAVEAYNYFVS